MLLDELASSAYYVHSFQEGYDASKKLLEENKLPPSEVQRIQANLVEYEKKINEVAGIEKAIMDQQRSMLNVTPNMQKSVISTPKVPVPNQTTLSIGEPKYKKKFKDRVKG